MDNKTYRINYYKNNLNLHGGSFKEILQRHFPSDLIRVNKLGTKSTIDEKKLKEHLNKINDKELNKYLQDLGSYENKKNKGKHILLKKKIN